MGAAVHPAASAPEPGRDRRIDAPTGPWSDAARGHARSRDVTSCPQSGRRVPRAPRRGPPRSVWLLPTAGVNNVMNRDAGPAHRRLRRLHRVPRGPRRAPPDLLDALRRCRQRVARRAARPGDPQRRFLGTIIVGYSLNRILGDILAPESRDRYQVTIVDEGGNLLVSSSPRTIHESNLGYELPLDPPGHGIRLQGARLRHPAAPRRAKPSACGRRSVGCQSRQPRPAVAALAAPHRGRGRARSAVQAVAGPDVRARQPTAGCSA